MNMRTSPSSARLIAAAGALLAVALLTATTPLQAQGLLSIESTGTTGNTTWSVPIQTLLVITALSFLPAVLLLMTSFTRIIIVLSLIRQAMGLQSTPPNQVLVGLSLFLTAFVMAPTLERIHDDAYKPFADQQLTFEQAIGTGSGPLREFMLRQTRSADLTLFAQMARIPTSGENAVAPAAMPMRVVVPAFVISELKTAFQIGFMVFVPFILIDLICASVLMSLGMMMVSPVLVALPFKLVLFVLADGWNLLIASLVSSFSP